MYYLNIFSILLVASIGLYAGVFGFREYTRITRTAEKVSAWRTTKIATCFGVAGSLVLFAIILFAGVIEENYVWSIPRIASAISISLILGVLITLGAGYQIYTTVLFRDMLIRRHHEKDNPEDHTS